jgi:glucose/arabinose dehydrogenase
MPKTRIPFFRSRQIISIATLVATVAIVLVAILPQAMVTNAEGPPPNFQVTPVFTGLNKPTDLQFASDGRVYVAEKRGYIKMFDNLDDPNPTVIADMSTNVFNGYDRGLLGIALPPNFPTDPSIYSLYTYDAPIGGAAPVWNDQCLSPPGATTDGCVVSGRLSRVQPGTTPQNFTEQVLIEDWCQQFPSHSIGSLAFGADGALYVSSGDGANYNRVDYGQLGGTLPNSSSPVTPRNPCGDPPVPVGGSPTPPSAEGGALRSLDLLTSGDPLSLDGTILRLDPATGQGAAGNPLAGSADANARRVVAVGLRNPYRMTVKPGSNELWIGDVGWNVREEINRLANPTDGAIDNFGWPCFEGNNRQSAYDNANLQGCEDLYTNGGVTAPVLAYLHKQPLANEGTDVCRSASGSSVSGLAFYTGGSYPDQYDDALFFSDYSRQCIWVMFKGSNDQPDPATRTLFMSANSPMTLRAGPDGDLFYVDHFGGKIWRISYDVNQPPTARFTTSETSGSVPLDVTFDGGSSTDPDPGDTLTYAWDLDGDGQYNDGTTPSITYTYTSPGNYTVRLRVTDSRGATDTESVVINAGAEEQSVKADILTPTTGAKWNVGDTIQFTGKATVQNQELPASAMSWSVVLHHCFTPGACHLHDVQSFNGVTGGSVAAPDHDYPSYLELRLTASWNGNQDTTSIALQPNTTTYSFDSDPEGQVFNYGEGFEGTTPFDVTVIPNSEQQVIAPQVQNRLSFISWTDGNTDYIRTFNVGTEAKQFKANYANKPPEATALARRVAGALPNTYAFSGTKSLDPEGDPLKYKWDFPDGTSSTEEQPVYTFPDGSPYPVKLTVTDYWGVTDSDVITVTSVGNAPPTPMITTPRDGAIFNVGDRITYSGSATDTGNVSIASDQLRWDVIGYRGDVATTLHTATGASGSFDVLEDGFSMIEVRLTAADGNGGSAGTSVRLRPGRIWLPLVLSR